jgi:thioredoxin reductase
VTTTDHTPPDRLELPAWEEDADPPDRVDVLVVGGGPAGLSAATWLGRYRRRTLVVDAGHHRNRAVDAIHGVLGRDPVAPASFRRAALEDLARYPHVTVRQGTVTTVDPDGDGFRAEVDGATVHASRLVLATGVRDVLPELEGIADHYGAGVQHCPTCEGFEARDRPVVVLGWGPHVPAFAAELLDWASELTIVAHEATARIDDRQRAQLADLDVEVIDELAVALVGPRGGLRAVRLASGREVAAEAVFFSIGHVPTTDLAVHLGCERTHEGVVTVDHEQATSVPGVFAAGDVTPGMQLVNVAIGEGTVAGVACAQSLQGRPTVPDAPPSAPAPEELAPPAVDAEDRPAGP